MKLLQTVDQISYKKVVSIAVFVAVLVAVPVAVILVQQQTKIGSRAAYEKPQVATQPKATPGPIPASPPHIGRAFPWVGKIGDIIWIQGTNFGSNPSDKKLTIGGVEITDAQIDAWEDDLIQAYIPDGVRQGGSVEVKVGNHQISKSLPIIIYDETAQVKLRKNGNIISMKDGNEVAKIIIWTGDDEIATEKHSIDVEEKSYDLKIFDTQGLPLLTIVLLNDSGKIVPYYVSPVEFNF